jgi:hypothetical protein
MCVGVWEAINGVGGMDVGASVDVGDIAGVLSVETG